MSGQGNEIEDDAPFEIVNPVFGGENPTGGNNGDGTVQARGSVVAEANGRQPPPPPQPASGQQQPQQQQQQQPQRNQPKTKRRRVPSSKGNSAVADPSPYDFQRHLIEPPTDVPSKRAAPIRCVVPPKATASGNNPILKGPIAGNKSAAEKIRASENIINNYKRHLEGTQPTIDRDYQLMNNNCNALFQDNEQLFAAIAVKDSHIKHQSEHISACQQEILRLKSVLNQLQLSLDSQKEMHNSTMQTKEDMIDHLKKEIDVKNKSLAIQETSGLVTHRTNESVRGAGEKANNNANIKEKKASQKKKAQKKRLKEVKANQHSSTTDGGWELSSNLPIGRRSSGGSSGDSSDDSSSGSSTDDDSVGRSNRRNRKKKRSKKRRKGRKRRGRDSRRRSKRSSSSCSSSSSGRSRSRRRSSSSGRSRSRRRSSSNYGHRRSGEGGGRRHSSEDSGRHDLVSRSESYGHDDSTLDTLPSVRGVGAQNNNQQLNAPNHVLQEEEQDDILGLLD